MALTAGLQKRIHLLRRPAHVAAGPSQEADAPPSRQRLPAGEEIECAKGN
jgi:hypothetical protein